MFYNNDIENSVPKAEGVLTEAHEAESCLTTFKNRVTNSYSKFTFACYLGSIPATYLMYSNISGLPSGRQNEMALTLTVGNAAWWSLTNLTPMNSLYTTYIGGMRCSLEDFFCTAKCLVAGLAFLAFVSPILISGPVGNLVLKFVDFLFNTASSQLTTAQAFQAGIVAEIFGGVMALFSFILCIIAIGACKKSNALNPEDKEVIRQKLLSDNRYSITAANDVNNVGHVPTTTNPIIIQ